MCRKIEKDAFTAAESSVEGEKKMRAMAHGIVNSKPLTDKENQEYQQQETTPPSQEQARRGPRELDQQEQVQQRAETLALKLAQTYEELTRVLEGSPRGNRQITECEAMGVRVCQS